MRSVNKAYFYHKIDTLLLADHSLSQFTNPTSSEIMFLNPTFSNALKCGLFIYLFVHSSTHIYTVYPYCMYMFIANEGLSFFIQKHA